MKTIIKSITLACAFSIFGANTTFSQEEPKSVNFNVAGDLVSSYIWRGMYQSGAAIQPTLGLSVKGFSLTAWGSVDFTGQGHKEADITAAYSIAGLTISVADFWWAGQSGIYNDRENLKNNYFNFNHNSTDHIFEGALSYQLPVERFPLSISWYTMFAGNDYVLKSNGTDRKRAYSTYVELGYPFSVKGVDLVANVGLSPWESAQYKNDGFAVTNVSLKATKVLPITKNFSLPIYTQVIWNPNREDVHFVFGLTIR